MSLKSALGLLEDEVASLAKAKPGEAAWFLRQAKVFGLSFLRRAQQLGIEDSVALDMLRQRFRNDVMRCKDDGSPT